MNFCIWITGLPGSGKSTIARELETMLLEAGIDYVRLELDGLRRILTPDPRYTDEEREIVYRALVLAGKLLVENSSKNVIIDATGNRRAFRTLARTLIREFGEVYVKCPLELSREREISRKGRLVERDLYRKAEKGELEGGLPGVSSPYEAPLKAEVEVDSDRLTPRESAVKIMQYIRTRWL
jgi:adenylylsulfate kinase